MSPVVNFDGMQARLLILLLSTARNAIRALDIAIEALELHLSEANVDPPQDAEPDPNAPCPHPPECRTPAATMGHPTRFLCRLCMESVDG